MKKNMCKNVCKAYSHPYTYQLIPSQDGFSDHKVKVYKIYKDCYENDRELWIKKNQ